MQCLQSLLIKQPRILELCGGVGVLGLSLARVGGASATLLCTDSNSHCAPVFAMNAKSVLGDPAFANGRARFAVVPASEMAAAAECEEFNFVVIDPPRRGLGRDVAARIAARRSVATILHLSCGLLGFCADADEFLRHGFRLERLRCYDSFPATGHAEILAVFVRVVATGHLRRAIQSRGVNKNR